MNKIWIIEDDASLARLISENLTKWGYPCEAATDFDQLDKDFLSVQPQLIIMDVSLPGKSGHAWCAEIRKLSKVPILFLSSHNENMDIIMALNQGGDDYLTKPFSMEILVARIQALLRRAYSYEPSGTLMEFQGAVFNLADASLSKDGRQCELTKNEFKILQILMENKGRLVSRDTLMTKLWETDDYIEENTLTVNIARLRKKLEKAGLDEFITTKVGGGYLIEVER